jgi:hypothetical protein
MKRPIDPWRWFSQMSKRKLRKLFTNNKIKNCMQKRFQLKRPSAVIFAHVNIPTSALSTGWTSQHWAALPRAVLCLEEHWGMLFHRLWIR